MSVCAPDRNSSAAPDATLKVPLEVPVFPVSNTPLFTVSVPLTLSPVTRAVSAPALRTTLPCTSKLGGEPPRLKIHRGVPWISSVPLGSTRNDALLPLEI